MSESEDERRMEDRAPITLRVDYKRLNTFFADYTKNISKGGTFIRTTRPLEVGTEFKFVLSMPALRSSDAKSSEAQGSESQGPAKESTELALQGVVKWVVTEGEATKDKPAGMGIKFIFTNDGDRKQVEDLVSGMMREALGDALTQKLLQKND